MKKRKAHMPFIVKLCFIAVLVYAAAGYVSNRVLMEQKHDELLVLQEQVERQKQINNRLEDALEREIDDEYVMEIARENLGYAVPGERYYIDISGG